MLLLSGGVFRFMNSRGKGFSANAISMAPSFSKGSETKLQQAADRVYGAGACISRDICSYGEQIISFG
ncbi:MAG TPA: hypothetical protein PK177_01310 [Burkholderiaceae bacterium]|nr:hypothetical protein [Burkholderiaceae bacterium]